MYDVLGNVTNRTEAWGGTSNFSEAFSYDGLNRLTGSQVSNQAQQTFTFDNLGNITSKSGVGNDGSGNPGAYGYNKTACNLTSVTGAAAPGPHAVTSIPGANSTATAFCYDADGNMLADPWRTTTWMSFDMPAKITGASGTSQFTYGPEHQRTRQIRSDMQLLYADGMEADVLSQGTKSTTVKTYWPAGLGLESSVAGGSPTMLWTHSDNLDSVVAVTNQSGSLVQQMAYDAWGARRDLAGDPGVISAANGSLSGQTLLDNKGFTHQEELDQLGLVHLNGRVYDPFTGRFLSGDPLVQDPYHSQSYNRYTYVWNNPTNLTDPTGFDATGVTIIGQRLTWGRFLLQNPEFFAPIAAEAATASFVVLIVVTPRNVGQKNAEQQWEDANRARWSAENQKATAAQQSADDIDFGDDQSTDSDALNSGSGGSAGAGAPPPPEDPDKNKKNDKKDKDKTKRPSRVRKGTEQANWNNAEDGENGGKKCPTCDKEVNSQPGTKYKDWDNDHNPAWRDRDLTGKERKEVLDEYNRNTRLRCTNCNRTDNGSGN